MSGLQVEKWNTETDGPLNVASMRRKLKSQGYSCIKYTFPPGTDFPDHTHNVSKKDSIIAGQFRFAMKGREVILQPGDPGGGHLGILWVGMCRPGLQIGTPF